MDFPRADPAAVARFRGLLPDDVAVGVRPMFGHPAAFVGGNMFLGVFGGDVFVRLSERDRPAALLLDGARVFEPMPGRAMREYIVLPPAVIDDPTLSRPWVDRSLGYARSLRPKAPKPPAARSSSMKSPRPRPGAPKRG
jgi:TfoX-like protein